MLVGCDFVWVHEYGHGYWDEMVVGSDRDRDGLRSRFGFPFTTIGRKVHLYMMVWVCARPNKHSKCEKREF